MSTRCPACASKNISIDHDGDPVQCFESDCRWMTAPAPPLTRDEIREIVMDCLKDYGVAKAIKRRKPVADLVASTSIGPDIYALSRVWLDCIGHVEIGRFGKAVKPLLDIYNAKWIEVGVRAYASELHREGKVRYASPESFAGRATGYILPALPANELTEREAELLGQDVVTVRNHAAAMGLLSERARG